MATGMEATERVTTFVEEYRTNDKSGWGPGPWQDEPDKVVWVDEKTGLDCMAKRNPHSGNWCGYVGVPEAHPDHGKGYEDVAAECHGGLTYAHACQETSDPGHGICHIPAPGRPAEVWWFGFDCAHFMDYMPAMAARLAELRAERPTSPPRPDALVSVEQYRDLGYVVAEVTQLAAQLARLAV